MTGPTVAALVAGRQRTFGHPELEAERFGTGDPGEIAALVTGFVRARLGSGIAYGIFHTVSIGSVTGLRLTDGRRVVVKLQPGWTSLPHLDAATEIQRSLARDGYPAPHVLAGPAALGSGHATIEQFLDPGEPSDAARPEIRAALAAGLADLIGRSAPLGRARELADGQFRRDADALFPPPHSSLFDFAATAAGAEWIDAHARRARAVLDEDRTPPVVGHDDWRAEHVRFSGTQIVAVYDWASLKAMPETTLVGNASRAYSLDFTTPVPTVPDRRDALA